MEAGAFPGAAFGVLFNGRIVVLDAVGAFTYEEGAPLLPPTLCSTSPA